MFCYQNRSAFEYGVLAHPRSSQGVIVVYRSRARTWSDLCSARSLEDGSEQTSVEGERGDQKGQLVFVLFCF